MMTLEDRFWSKAEFGVSQQAVGDIWMGNTWRELFNTEALIPAVTEEKTT